ncbi:MAG TPA: glycosyltransferase [Terriglobia bacterium]|nr:glycosyltransferase [Terriglobia bacterium]
MAIKTLHFTNYYHSRSGGIRTMYHALLQAAERQRRPMQLVVPGETDRVEPWGEFTRIYHVAAPQSPLFDSQYRLILPHRFLLPFPTAIRKIIESERPDLIEICDKYALSCLAWAVRKHWIPRVGRPLLVGLSCERLDDNLAVYVGPRWRGAASLFMKRVYRPLFDRHIAVSSYVAEELVDETEVGGEHVTVLPMGVVADSFGPQHRSAEARCRLLQKLGGNNRSRLLLYAGRLSREKNIRLLVDTMLALGNVNGTRQAQDYRLLVAGRGPMEPWLQEQAQHLNGRIVLLGHISDRKVLAELLANTDVFIHPNPREPFGITPLEAMCSELPLVAPSYGGVTSYCNAENAWITEPNGPSFAASVHTVFDDPVTRAARVSKGRRTALAHDWNEIATRFFETYDSFYRSRQVAWMTLPSLDLACVNRKKVGTVV